MEPGIGFRGLMRATGIPTGTLRWHVNVLMRVGRVWCERVANVLMHFPGPRPVREQAVRAAIVDVLPGRDRQAYAVIAGRPGCLQRDVIASLSWPSSSVQYRLYRLQRLGLVYATPSGRSVRYEVVA